MLQTIDVGMIEIGSQKPRSTGSRLSPRTSGSLIAGHALAVDQQERQVVRDEASDRDRQQPS